MLKIELKKLKFNNQIIEKYPIYIIIFLFLLFFTLSFFRNPYPDERKFYLIETSYMSDLLAKGEWFGNDSVGLHGFLFKLPVALIFLISGPSIFIATLFNIILAILCCFLFYKIIEKYIDENYLKFIGLLLFSTSYYFIAFSPTYTREIPAIFSLLLFLFLIISKKNRILIGLSLLLLLDAKEHVFFQIIPGILIWLIYHHFIKIKDKKLFFRIRDFILDNILYFTPSIILLLLMFFTKFVPINMFVAYILGLIGGGIEDVTSSFISYGTASMGLKLKYPERDFFTIYSILFPETSKLLPIPNYFTKFFMPRLFSFVSIPQLIVVPALITSCISFVKSENEYKEDSKLFFLVLWSYLISFYLRDSNGRYLFPISPLIFIFFIQFLRNIDFNKKNIIIYIIVCSSILLALIFEYQYLKIKILLNIFLIIFLFLLIYNNKRKLINKNILFLLFSGIYIFIIVSTTIFASYTMPDAQINSTLKYGYCKQIYKINNKIPDKTRIWINNGYDADILRFYKMDMLKPAEFKWDLQDWIPKKYMLKKYESIIFNYNYNDINEFKNKLKENKIKKVIFQYSLIPDYTFMNQDDIETLKSQQFLILQEELKLKNKIVYIFNVI